MLKNGFGLGVSPTTSTLSYIVEKISSKRKRLLFFENSPCVMLLHRDTRLSVFKVNNTTLAKSAFEVKVSCYHDTGASLGKMQFSTNACIKTTLKKTCYLCLFSWNSRCPRGMNYILKILKSCTSCCNTTVETAAVCWTQTLDRLHYPARVETSETVSRKCFKKRANASFASSLQTTRTLGICVKRRCFDVRSL